MLPSAPSPTTEFPVFEFPWDIPPNEYDSVVVYEDEDQFDYDYDDDDEPEFVDDGEAGWAPSEEVPN